MALPPETTRHGTDDIGENIEWIGGGVLHEPWPDPLKEQGPKNQMERNLTDLRRRIIGSQSQAAVEPEDGRQRARNQPTIVEVRVKKTAVDMRFDHPTIYRIGKAAGQKQ